MLRTDVTVSDQCISQEEYVVNIIYKRANAGSEQTVLIAPCFQYC